MLWLHFTAVRAQSSRHAEGCIVADCCAEEIVYTIPLLKCGANGDRAGSDLPMRTCRALWVPARDLGRPGVGSLSRLLVIGHGAPEQTRPKLPFIPLGNLQGEPPLITYTDSHKVFLAGITVGEESLWYYIADCDQDQTSPPGDQRLHRPG